jgi:hypothetical protein
MRSFHRFLLLLFGRIAVMKTLQLYGNPNHDQRQFCFRSKKGNFRLCALFEFVDRVNVDVTSAWEVYDSLEIQKEVSR